MEQIPQNKTLESAEMDRVVDLLNLVGKEFQPKPTNVDQQRINKFADATGDYNPVHINPESAHNSIFGGVVAHGLLTASLAAHEQNIWSIVKIKEPFELIANQMNMEWLRPCPVDSTIQYKFLLSEAKPTKIKDKEAVKTIWKITPLVNNKPIMQINWTITYIVL
jgi:acyl dehydratase